MAYTRFLLVASGLPVVVLCVVLLFEAQRTWTLILAAYLVGTVVAWILVGRLKANGRGLGPFWLLAALNLLIVVPELGLRAAKFQYASGARFAVAAWARSVSSVADPTLLWRVPAGEGGNSMGFLGPDPIVPKPPDTYRLLILGDSCSMQPGWPSSLQSFLNVQWHDRGVKIECFSHSLAGYSSYHGPINVYRENLQANRDVIGQTPLVSLTTPTSHGVNGVPVKLPEVGLAKRAEEVIELHRRNNDVVREVAAADRTYLLDLEREYGTAEAVDGVFTKEGIHHTRRGVLQMAARIGSFLESQRLHPAGPE